MYDPTPINQEECDEEDIHSSISTCGHMSYVSNNVKAINDVSILTPSTSLETIKQLPNLSITFTLAVCLSPNLSYFECRL